MLEGQSFRANKQEKIHKLYNAKQLNESGIILGQDALNFIQEAFSELNDQEISAELNEESKTLVYKATQSLNLQYEGFTFIDFMRTILALCAWNAQGRADTLTNDDRVRNMITGGYKSTKDHID